jgi:hypothetical protein
VKRICLLGAAMAGLLVAGVATAPAATTHSTKKSTKLTCTLKLVDQIPSDDTAVTQGAGSGTQFGTAACGKPLGRGVEQDSFTLDDAGDLVGPYQQWFNTGSVRGQYVLTPNDSQSPTLTFSQASYSGTIKVTGGTGAFNKASGTGTLTCSTQDSAHYSCTEKLKLS